MGVTGASARAREAAPRPMLRAIKPRVFIDTTCSCYKVKCRTAYPRMVPSPRARYRFLFLVLQRTSQFHRKFAYAYVRARHPVIPESHAQQPAPPGTADRRRRLIVPVTVPRARGQRGRKLGAFFEHLLMRLLCGFLSRGLVRLAILWRLGQGFDGTIGLLAEHRLPQRVVHRYPGWIYLATDVQHAIETADLRGVERLLGPRGTRHCDSQADAENYAGLHCLTCDCPYLRLACALPARLTSLPWPSSTPRCWARRNSPRPHVVCGPCCISPSALLC